MIKAHPLTLLLMWILAFAVNAMLSPVYLWLFGALGAILLVGGLCLLAIAALFLTYNAISTAKQSSQKLLYIIGFDVIPFLVMAGCGLFLIRPLAELSYVSIYGPRHTTH
jgi:hypothetical protein